MGGNKAVEINQYPLLAWYHKKFAEYLSCGTRLMVIGYSFSDRHINQAIMTAADKGNLRLFIIDPKGVDVLNKQDPRHIQHETDLMARLNPYIIGASRRSLSTTFASDRVEHGRLTRFFYSVTVIEGDSQQMPTYQQFQVEPVRPFLNGHGFNISNQHHRPLFSIVYPTAAEAETARDAISAALAKAIEVSNYA